MKTYKSFIAFTLSLALLFVVAYFSGIFLEGGKEYISSLYSKKIALPKESVFVIIWGIAYACMVSQMSVRKGIKVWLALLALNLLFTLLYFRFSLHYLGASLILLNLVLLTILTSFYVRNTRYLWLLSIPLLAIYGYSLFLVVVTAL